MSGSRTCYTRHLVPAGAGVRSVPTKHCRVLFYFQCCQKQIIETFPRTKNQLIQDLIIIKSFYKPLTDTQEVPLLTDIITLVNDGF